MTHVRIPPLDPPFADDVRSEFDKIMRGAPPLKLFRTVARNPRVLQRWFAGNLLDKGSIALRVRELMILRTTALNGAEYEWGVHVATFGAKAAWTEQELRSTVHGSAADACWSAAERAVIELADRLHATSRVDDATWLAVSSAFTPEQLIELVMLAGGYRSVSYLVNAFGVELEENAPRFPSVSTAS